MNKSSLVIVSLVALAIGFAASWYVASKRPVELEAGQYFGEQARALPDFELVDHANRAFDRGDLDGRWSLLFFGYTHCPDVCPITLQTLADAVARIDDDDVRDELRIYFVSIDPERDTPARLAEYVTYFDPGFTGLTAPLERLKTLTRALGIAHDFRNKTAGASAYDVDHSSAIVLINPRGEYAGIFGAPHDPAVLARDLTRIVEHG